MSTPTIHIGVLALQGAFREHVRSLRQLPGVAASEIRRADEFDSIDGLIIPGGESTAMGLLAERCGLVEVLKEWVGSGKPVWGTCAGMILLSDRVAGQKEGHQPLIGGLHVTAHRNFFGSQLQSFEAVLKTCISNEAGADFGALSGDGAAPADSSRPAYDCPAIFIRAPAILDVDDDVKVLASLRTRPHPSAHLDWEEERSVVVAAQQGQILVTAFHPELTDDLRWHRVFAGMVRSGKQCMTPGLGSLL